MNACEFKLRLSNISFISLQNNAYTLIIKDIAFYVLSYI